MAVTEATDAVSDLRADIEALVEEIKTQHQSWSDDVFRARGYGGRSEAQHRLGYLHGAAVAHLNRKDLVSAVAERRRLRGMTPSNPTRPVGSSMTSNHQATAGEQGAAPLQVDFPPVANGIDYLSSVVDHLTRNASPPPRDLKYAVLHLYAATEVLLKVRLAQEHWALIWNKPADATSQNHKERDFNSCTPGEAIRRLQVLDIDVAPQAGRAITKLGRDRNKLQHDGLTAAAPAVEARAAEVLDFLLAFIHQHLEQSISAQLAEELETIRAKVQDINSFVRERRKRLNGLLVHPEITVQCPHCDQWALVPDGNTSVTCHFCDTTQEARDAAHTYAVEILNKNEYAMWGDEGERPTLDCPACPEYESLVTGVITLAAAEKNGKPESADDNAAPHAPVMQYLCFNCGETGDFTNLTECSDGCGTVIESSGEGFDLCSACFSSRVDQL